ncbi:MAG TPA: GNAT family N-acetyltransferase [Solirubrobacter sp.]|jgi:GNAT superfamily N-acetyltransferase|nr:GNAT family N-acetyltransferase [Solirubrobacter sp.]
MGWCFTDDVEAYAERAWELLARDPVGQTVALSVIERVRAGHRWSDRGQIVFGCYDVGGGVRGAVSLTPPFELLLAVVPGDAVAELVAALRRASVEFPGVNGDAKSVEAFAAAWTRETGVRPVPVHRMRLYRLQRLCSPAVPPPGRARPGVPDDIETAVRWLQAFEIEAGTPRTNVEAAARMAIDDGRLWVWEDPAGAAVSLASRTRTVVGVGRIAPVYTPPDRRRRGYGAAVTAACTHDALARGATDVALFADLANPTANSIYQRIGYVPVREQHVVHFERPDSRGRGARR